MSVARAARRWLLAGLAFAALTFGLSLARGRLGGAHVALAYLLLVLGASAAGGRALGFAAAGASFAAFTYAFVPPYRTLGVADPLDWLVLGAFLVTSVVATQLLYRAEATAAAAVRRAAELDHVAAVGAASLGAPGVAEALVRVPEAVRAAEVGGQAVLGR
ncbi:DUF4118 domain-containing protein, partial [Roseisolibacter sp. H3M3-2]|uniref:DUF4118 domain-containing protein n=1 Tax=Roseisolibacter sp. H3M3-2 TaxID=3031323 RepID=UPI0023DAF436